MTVSNRLARAAILCLFSGCATAQALAQITNPIPERIAKSGIQVEITDFVTIPASSGSSPRARINHLRPVPDTSGRLFVNDLRGTMYVIRTGAVSTYLNLKAARPGFIDSPGLGTGFTSFTFDPEFSTSGRFYTAHMEAANSGVPDIPIPVSTTIQMQGVIMEWTASNPAADVFAGTNREIMRVNLFGTVHGFQEISFNPHAAIGSPDYRKLYICLGDAGCSIGGRTDATHRLDSPWGTIMRIDPFGTNGRNGKYGIPTDNPWASDGNPATLDELWAYGFRNPHRISWDGVSGKMLLGDIGERNIEEVNLITPGGDYGWNVREGPFVINWGFSRDVVFPLPQNDAANGFTYPVSFYDHDDGIAIVGGFVYRGPSVPAIAGQYVFGDIVSGRVFHAHVDSLVQGTQTPPQELTLLRNGVAVTLLATVGGSRADLRFGQDNAGELYILTKGDGKIRRIEAAAQPPPTTVLSELSNISSRGLVGTGDEIMIGGFVIEGSAGRKVLLRGVGPALGAFGVTGFVTDPVLTLFRGSTQLETNNDWGTASNAAEIASTATTVGAFSFANGSKDAAILITLEPGAYTVHVAGIGGATGVGMFEAYAVD